MDRCEAFHPLGDASPHSGGSLSAKGTRDRGLPVPQGVGGFNRSSQHSILRGVADVVEV